MSVTLIKGQVLTKDDLNIYLQDGDGNYVNPYAITYTIFRVTSRNWYNQQCAEESILETINSVPIPFGIGKFFAPWVMPKDITIGPYRIKWSIRQYTDSPAFDEVEEFDVIIRDPVTQAQLYQAGVSTKTLLHNQFKGGCAG